MVTAMHLRLGGSGCFLDIYMGQFCALLGCSTLTDELLSFPISDGRFFMTGKYLNAQYGQNDFDHAKNNWPGFFIIVTGAETLDLWITGGSYKNVDIQTEEKRVIDNFMELKLLIISAQSVFVGHGCLQHVVTAWIGTPSILYHICLILQGHEPMFVVLFAYPSTFRRLVNRGHSFPHFWRPNRPYCTATVKNHKFAGMSWWWQRGTWEVRRTKLTVKGRRLWNGSFIARMIGRMNQHLKTPPS